MTPGTVPSYNPLALPVAASSPITIVIPARDEEGIISSMIEASRPHGHVLVVDGHSRDRTREVAAACGAEVILDGGRGKGEALRRSIAHVKAGIIVFLDADGSHDARDIPALIAPILADEADLVIGSRGKGGSDELHGTLAQFVRYIGSQLIMLGINYRWNVRLTDSQNGFRAIRHSTAVALGLRSNLSTIEQEMLMRALKRDYRVTEIASHEYARQWGSSKISVPRLWWAYIWSFLRNIG